MSSLKEKNYTLIHPIKINNKKSLVDKWIEIHINKYSYITGILKKLTDD